MAATLVLVIFPNLTIHKLKPCTNQILHDETIHPLLSHYSSTNWGEGRGTSFKFWPIGGALIRAGRGGGLIQGFKVC